MPKSADSKYNYNRFGQKGQRVGQAILDIVSKDQPSQTVEDTMVEFGPDYVKEFETAVNYGCKHFQSPFYVMVLSKKEMWACNLVRNYFIPRQTYPYGTETVIQYPNYTKTLYKVNANTQQIDILWSIPGHSDCQVIASNPSAYDPQLVQWIFQCYAGKFDIEVSHSQKIPHIIIP